MSEPLVLDIVEDFKDGRAIALYLGAYVMVDAVPYGGWEFSGEPARPGRELETLNRLVRALGEGTTVIVTPPEGS